MGGCGRPGGSCGGGHDMRRLFACSRRRGKSRIVARFSDDVMLYPDGACSISAFAMNQLTISTSRLDRLAMGLSGLCLVHCVATAVLLGLLASAGGFLGS